MQSSIDIRIKRLIKNSARGKDMTYRTCYFTGDTYLEKNNEKQFKNSLDKIISYVLRNDFDTFIGSCYRGFDMIFALSIVAIKQTREDVKLILVVPSDIKEKNYTLRERDTYFELLRKADKVYFTSDVVEQDGVNKPVTDFMLELSSACIVYTRSDNDKIMQTINKADKQGLIVLRV